MIEPDLPAVAAEIIEAIGREVPGYATRPDGPSGDVQGGVSEALRQFIGLIRNPNADRESSRNLCLSLGRDEFESGRTLDSLQLAYRVGARIAWRRIAATSLQANLDGKTLSLLAEAIFVYINELSSNSTEGYAEAQSEGLGEKLRRERRLVSGLLRNPAIAPPEMDSLSAAAGWQPAERASTLSCHERDLAEINRSLPNEVISAMVDATGCVVIPDATGPEQFRLIHEAVGGRPAALGPEMALGELRNSWRLARSALSAIEAGAIKSSGLIRADEHLADLALFESRDLISRLGQSRLAPLEDLTPNARSRMAETTVAWLDYRGNAAEMARALQIHPQTARYRVARLRELFGDSLDDPRSRFELELALRGKETV
ncbi:MAG: helix-turn-helix domain-containing protein [Solirubrobacterales bacterium]